MDQDPLVTDNLTLASRLVSAIESGGIGVEQAAWVYDVDGDAWRLIIGIESRASRSRAYELISEVLSESQALEPSRVTIVHYEALDRISAWRNGLPAALPRSGNLDPDHAYPMDLQSLRYENAVTSALVQALPSVVVEVNSSYGGHELDALLRLPGNGVCLLEVKATRQPLSDREVSLIVARLRRAVRSMNADDYRFAIVSKAGFTASALKHSGLGLLLVQWVPGDPPELLASELLAH